MALCIYCGRTEEDHRPTIPDAVWGEGIEPGHPSPQIPAPHLHSEPGHAFMPGASYLPAEGDIEPFRLALARAVMEHESVFGQPPRSIAVHNVRQFVQAMGGDTKLPVQKFMDIEVKWEPRLIDGQVQVRSLR